MTDVTFVNKPHNNAYFEWGKNCATLGFDENRARRAFDEHGIEFAIEDRDMFWEGYTDGPRTSGEIYSINPFS